MATRALKEENKINVVYLKHAVFNKSIKNFKRISILWDAGMHRTIEK